MIFTTLMPHQKKALAYLREHDPCILSMFLGSGKSLVALAYAEAIGAKRILITSDKNNILNTWPDQIYRHTDYEVWVRPSEYQSDHLWKRPFDPTCVCVNYDWLKNKYRRDEYASVKWDLWIGDESGEFKDQRTNRYRMLRHVVERIPHKVLLNGKLVTERLEDIYGQLSLIDGRRYLAPTMYKFHEKYMQPDVSGYGWTPKRSALTQIQKDIAPISYWLKDDGSIKMPKSHYYAVTVPMTEEQERIDNELKETFAASLNGIEVETNYAAVVYQKRIQVAGGILRGEAGGEGSDDSYAEIPTRKLEVLRKVVDHNPQAKIVVWHTYIPETELLSRTLREMDHPFMVIDSSEKTDLLNAFGKEEQGCVLLIRTSLCKGLNQLADADIAVFYSNPLSYSRRAQAEGRTRRVSSTTEDTHIIDIITEGGADRQVYSLLSQKKSFSMTLTNLRKMLDCAI